MDSESFYCLTTSDAKFNAYAVFQRRIAEKKWPMYSQTKFQSIMRRGDNILFYIAGVHEFRQCFVASAKVKEIKSIKDKKETTIDPDKMEVQVTAYIYLDNIKLFKNKIFIKDIINDLAFIGNKKNYGLYFVGGVTRVDEESNKLIVNKSIN